MSLLPGFLAIMPKSSRTIRRTQQMISPFNSTYWGTVEDHIQCYPYQCANTNQCFWYQWGVQMGIWSMAQHTWCLSSLLQHVPPLLNVADVWVRTAVSQFNLHQENRIGVFPYWGKAVCPVQHLAGLLCLAQSLCQRNCFCQPQVRTLHHIQVTRKLNVINTPQLECTCGFVASYCFRHEYIWCWQKKSIEKYKHQWFCTSG
jgi:hypothetical protein